MHSIDIIVVGAGVAGCAAAAALADGRRRVLLLEARQGLKQRLAGELLHPTGVQVLDELGFMPHLRAAGGVDVEGFAVCRDRAAAPVRLPYREIADSRSCGFAIEHLVLVETMRRVVAGRPGIELRRGQQVEALVHDRTGRVCGVRTQQGPILAPLVLGCDGRSSKIRALLGLIAHSQLVSFSVGLLLPDGDSALPCPGFGHIFLAAWGPILAYPIRELGGQRELRCSFDVTRELSGGPAGAAQLLRRDYVPHLPPGLQARLLAALDAQAPLIAANEIVRTDRAVARGAALVGDAGGCSHPLTATGMSIGLMDAQSLGRVLQSPGSFLDEDALDARLRQYEATRYRFVRAREVLADALYEVFRAAEPGTRALCEGLFRYWEGSQNARARSMALLSGASSDPFVFLKEYLKVVAFSGSAAIRGTGSSSGHISDRIRALFGLGQKSLEKLGLVLQVVHRELVRSRAE